MSFDNLIPIRTFVNRMEAEIARSALEAAGIHAVLERDDCGGTRPSLWLTGIALLVRPDDRDAAGVVLDTPALYAAPDLPEPGAPRTVSAFDFQATTIDGALVHLDVYRGSVLLIVNVASQCGYTPQYRGLEDLYRRHREAGLVVLGFPCDQFGRQEPGTDAEIRAFCLGYDVTFPLFRKINVNGNAAHPLYQFLKSQKKGWLGLEAIKWNFTKFLVDRQGRVVGRYGATDTPEAIEPDIVRAVGGQGGAENRERRNS